VERWRDNPIRMSPEAKKWLRIWKERGRLVKCTDCFGTQRTKPQAHVDGVRLREMACGTEGCLGRLRSLGWWDELSQVRLGTIADRALRRRGVGIRARQGTPARGPRRVH